MWPSSRTEEAEPLRRSKGAGYPAPFDFAKKLPIVRYCADIAHRPNGPVIREQDGQFNTICNVLSGALPPARRK